MRVLRLPGSKRVIGPTPLLPASSASQVASTPVASGVTRPRPVTTTRRRTMPTTRRAPADGPGAIRTGLSLRGVEWLTSTPLGGRGRRHGRTSPPATRRTLRPRAGVLARTGRPHPPSSALEVYVDAREGSRREGEGGPPRGQVAHHGRGRVRSRGDRAHPGGQARCPLRQAGHRHRVVQGAPRGGPP